MSENALNEVEKTLLYISEARERASRARAALDRVGAERHLVLALQETRARLPNSTGD